MAGELGGTLAIKWRFGGAMGGGHNPPVMLDACPCCAPASQPDSHACYWSHLQLSDDGQELKWFADHGAAIADIIMNAAGTHAYIANNPGTGYGAKSIRKIDSGSGIVWSQASSFLPQGDGGCLAVMSNDDVICQATNLGAVDPDIIRRAAADGSEVWRKRINLGVTFGACVDSSDNIYLARNGSLQKLNSSGVSQWVTTITGGSAVSRAVATDGSQIYVAGSGLGATAANLQAYTMSGTLVWSTQIGLSLSAVTCTPGGDIVTGGVRVNFPGFPLLQYTTHCFDSSGSFQWGADHGATVNGICADSSGNIYTVGVLSPDKVTTRKYNSSGALQWSHDYTYGKTSFNGAQTVAADNAGNVYVGGSWMQG